ncbi:hypothetical protein AAUPMC_03944 [Pasteurella multocida subsp. multocida str. Anand1_cattle]|nr:hypothetical protein AAUPMC_03944 [Pasteurella multocida subsp. multocida str. Anand1_cattle]
MTALYPHLVEKLIVIDIAPVKYGHHGHDAVFAGLFATKQAKPKTRQEAKHYLAQYIPEEAIQQFMLKSFDANAKEYFRFNLSALHANYPHIMDWQPCHCTVPTLFIPWRTIKLYQNRRHTTYSRAISTSHRLYYKWLWTLGSRGKT